MVALGDLICWNNLGRNVVFADRRFRPRAVFGQTLFPDQDEPSQYDLDIHAILDLPERGLVLGAEPPGLRPRLPQIASSWARGRSVELEPAATTFFAADVERTVLAGTSLVGSGRACEGAEGVAGLGADRGDRPAGRRRSRPSWRPSASAR